MSGRRVAVTGVGVISPIGVGLDESSLALREGKTGIVSKPEWSAIEFLSTRLAGEVGPLDLEKGSRKQIRTMGRVALLATRATEQAVADAGIDPESLRSERAGIAYGSTHGSSIELERFCRVLFVEDSLKGLSSTSYLKFMSNTCAANLALFFGVRGRVVSTCAACVSGSLAIGAGYEAIRGGAQDVMLCGGSEELHFLHAGVFDMLFATSTRYNERPGESPRPFDAERDGLVVGEGAGTLVLEEWEKASARGARIHAEIVGFGTNCDGAHLTAPSEHGMAGAVRLALGDARVSASDVDYVHAHATGTDVGDVCESRATLEVFGDRVPVSSTKGQTGHTLGACGAMEAVFCIAMIRDGFVAATRNLERVDPRCAPLDYVVGEARRARPRLVALNTFAFGGVNTSLLLRAV